MTDEYANLSVSTTTTSEPHDLHSKTTSTSPMSPSSSPHSPSVVVTRHSFQSYHQLVKSFFTRGSDREQLLNPFDVTLFHKSSLGKLMLISDYSNHRVMICKAEDGAFVSEIHVKHPHGICVDEVKGELLATDCNDHLIKVFRIETGQYVRNIGKGCGTQNGQFNAPSAICLDLKNDCMFVSDYGNNRIQKFKYSTGEFIKSFGNTPNKHVITNEAVIVEENQSLKNKERTILDKPWGLSLDKIEASGIIHHVLYVCDTKNNCIRLFDSTNGNFIGNAISNAKTVTSHLSNATPFLKTPYAVIVDGNRLLISDSGNHCVKIFTKPRLTMADPNTLTILKEGYYVDSIGRHNYIYEEVPSFIQNIKEFPIEFSHNVGMALDSFKGELYVSDCSNHRIQIIK
ncbi:predicted protein [Naegleria gruberi]|uniref:Predicted protein n=1 Tax=Naegleria gruberi TaxID=5762 RepID=D2W3V4_NAEGR|nr:uncharacterized protein NAEGRDRAFT_76078 [Naegleria gruberi]EFC36237.1 predicted protein [Naegleria gruberi]|eukprot:XP_002668981.1 predicted protein [Naegleria gruberi strain NEG-M]